MKIYLKENLRAIRVFLNLFNLKLEEAYDLTTFQNLAIFNANNEVVGNLKINDDLIYFHAFCGDIKMEALCKLKEPTLISDNDTSLNNKISYRLLDDTENMIKGDFYIRSFELANGLKNVDCSQVIERYREGILEFRASFGENKILSLDFGLEKAVDIDLYSLDHKGHYKRQVPPVIPNYKTVIIIDSETKQPYIARESYPLSTDTKEMIAEDQNTLRVYYMVDLLRRKLMINDVPLFDRLSSISLNALTDSEFYRFLGFGRTAITYQNNSENLVDAYFTSRAKQK